MQLKHEVIAGMVNRSINGRCDGPTDTYMLERIERVLKHVRFPAKPKILGTSLKVEKSKKDKTLTAVIYLSASDRSEVFGGFNTCPNASAGCRAACLGHTAGRLTMDSSQNAQVWKTLAFRYARSTFMSLLMREIEQHRARARRQGLACSVRLNGTSDLAWERIAPELFTTFSDVQFYDYTKSEERALRSSRMTANAWPANYHLTFSRSEDTPDERVRWLASYGVNVAVVFRGDLPMHWQGLDVIDGDTTDYRAGDPAGVIVGLSVKGNVEDSTGFYV